MKGETGLPTRYFLGIDGGSTKTLAVLGDEQGNLLSLGRGGASNYHVVGLTEALGSVSASIDAALAAAAIQRESVAGVVYALAGADDPVDFATLAPACTALLPSAPGKLVNDTWAALRGGTKADWGAVSICGGGHNAAARNRTGERTVLRGMTYEIGNKGGGYDLIRDALFHAFRANERVGPPTMLEARVLEVLGVDSYDTLASFMRLLGTSQGMRGGPAGGANGGSSEGSTEAGLPGLSLVQMHELASGIIPAIFDAAGQGDAVAQEILIDMGRLQGEALAAVIERLDMQKEAVDVVLAGSVYRGENPLLIDSLTLALHRRVPLAHPHLPLYEPVIGAYLLALEEAGIDLTDGVHARLQATRRALFTPAQSPATT